jgi:hypothetical protein
MPNTKVCSKCYEEKSIDRFSTHGNQCKNCAAKRMREYRKANPDIMREIDARKYWKQPERMREESRWRHTRRKYGVDKADYDRMFTNQNGLCALCGNQPENNESFMIDHNHETETVHGLLCKGCNWQLGWAERHLIEIQAYLSSHSSGQ